MCKKYIYILFIKSSENKAKDATYQNTTKLQITVENFMTMSDIDPVMEQQKVFVAQISPRVFFLHATFIISFYLTYH